MKLDQVESGENFQKGLWCAGEDWCPITATAEILGKKWHTVVVHRLLEEPGQGFNELKRNIDGISSKVLSETLDDLRDHGLVEKEEVSESPRRVSYTLTGRGESMEQLIEEMRKWGQEHLG